MKISHQLLRIIIQTISHSLLRSNKLSCQCKMKISILETLTFLNLPICNNPTNRNCHNNNHTNNQIKITFILLPPLEEAKTIMIHSSPRLNKSLIANKILSIKVIKKTVPISIPSWLLRWGLINHLWGNFFSDWILILVIINRLRSMSGKEITFTTLLNNLQLLMVWEKTQ